MRLTRCLLRYGGMCAPDARSIVAPQGLPVQYGGEKKIFVRSGIRTHALIRGPEISAHPLSGDKAQALSLAP